MERAIAWGAPAATINYKQPTTVNVVVVVVMVMVVFGVEKTLRAEKKRTIDDVVAS